MENEGVRTAARILVKLGAALGYWFLLDAHAAASADKAKWKALGAGTVAGMLFWAMMEI